MNEWAEGDSQRPQPDVVVLRLRSCAGEVGL
jgi:hypothetical protein